MRLARGSIQYALAKHPSLATLSVAGLLIINILLSQRETSISIDTGVPPPGPISSSQPPSPPPAPDAVHRCANMARNYRVVPGVSWGTLSEAQKVRWKSLNCDGIITLDVLLEPAWWSGRRRGGATTAVAAASKCRSRVNWRWRCDTVTQARPWSGSQRLLWRPWRLPGLSDPGAHTRRTRCCLPLPRHARRSTITGV